MLFYELSKHGVLAFVRHPMYSKNLFVSILIVAGWLFGTVWMLALGTILALTADRSGMTPGAESFPFVGTMTVGVILLADFLLRWLLQKVPTQNMKPYLLLPVPRRKLVEFLLFRTLFYPLNWIWGLAFLPYCIFIVGLQSGALTALGCFAGLCLLVWVNNFLFVLCRTLTTASVWGFVLPFVVYGGLMAGIWAGGTESFLSRMLLSAFGCLTSGNIFVLIGLAVTVVGLWITDRRIICELAYAELAKVKDAKIKKIRTYGFFERFGETGEYMKLELKLWTRNAVCRKLLVNALFLTPLLVYINAYMVPDAFGATGDFWLAYCFLSVGILLLGVIMSFEGNYIDCLMVRNGSVLALLKGKYFIFLLVQLFPILILMPLLLTGRITLLAVGAWCFWTMGVGYCCLFQLAVYNMDKFPLNEAVSGKQQFNGMKLVVNFGTFGLSYIVNLGLRAYGGEVFAYCVMLAVGAVFVLSSPFWLGNIANRFMKRRYVILESFR